jgi:pyroglutamyl-peptidase
VRQVLEIGASPIGETAALTVLVTGFSAFPGTHANPTEALARALHSCKARFARRGIRLEPRVLPVVYSAVGPAIAKHIDALAPDIILHFGVATRRKEICVETIARNRVSTLHCDAAGRQAGRASILPGGPSIAKVRVPAVEIATAVRRSGCPSRLSNDAGGYLCNAAFYLSLTASHAARAPQIAHVGFIHVPRLRSPNHRRSATQGRQRPTLPALVRAAEIAILQAAIAARRNRQIPPTHRVAAPVRETSAAFA